MPRWVSSFVKLIEQLRGKVSVGIRARRGDLVKPPTHHCNNVSAGYMNVNTPVKAPLCEKLFPHFSQDGVREAHRLRLPRHYLLQRAKSVAVRVPGMVQRGGGVPGRRVLVRRESVGADAGYPLPAAERNGRHESGRAASESCQYVLHDETANKIR